MYSAQIFTDVFTSVQPQGIGNTLTSDRLWASLAVVLALVGLIIGGWVLNRAADRNHTDKKRLGAIVAMAAGLIAVAIGGLLLATADGGPGTGNGTIGAVVALVLGLIDIVLGRLGMLRIRRAD